MRGVRELVEVEHEHPLDECQRHLDVDRIVKRLRFRQDGAAGWLTDTGLLVADLDLAAIRLSDGKPVDLRSGVLVGGHVELVA